jgi:hypothetical protein
VSEQNILPAADIASEAKRKHTEKHCKSLNKSKRIGIIIQLEE